ncbi:non-ribosomal peptide synthetase [Pedobacter cryoconitis]|uniref:Amino acid adenylation domain-containing protein n=1 Tax=Pedobacter cryoconitis TaxID=188932 RepID=A0A327SJ90_9SPHI|nr:non-ribosomal peptide synthetase [Pedobacter cryoconitis]RAJ29236.1 amino acid adenylation domain-containing protein [Pedobacter cryoconitis]
MEIKEFIAELYNRHFSLNVQDGKLTLRGDKNKLTNEQIAAIRSDTEVINYIKNNKQALIDYLEHAEAPETRKRHQGISAIYRLSGLQEGMLFHGLYDGGAAAYLEQFTCDLSQVNTGLLQESWKLLLQRHTILRSSFDYESLGMPVQCVHEEVVLPFQVVDFRQHSPEIQQAEIASFIAADLKKGIDFKKPPLMRISLLQTGEDTFFMVWTYHHILLDGWSMSVLMEELLAYYELLADGQEVKITEQDKYEDYIRYIESRGLGAQEEYWRTYMEGVEAGSLLPFIQTPEGSTKGAGSFKEELLVLDQQLKEKADAYIKAAGLTLNTLIQGVWAFILHNYTGKTAVTYGVTVSGRPEELSNMETRVGMYINTLPLHTAVKHDTAIAEWLAAIQDGQIMSREYGYTALSTIQKWTGVTGDLFDSILVFENYPVGKSGPSGPGKLLVDNVVIKEHNNYPLSIIVAVMDEINILFMYNEEILGEVYVQQLKRHFEQVLSQIISPGKDKVGDLVLVEGEDKEQLLHHFNDNSSAYEHEDSIVSLFQKQVEQTPSAVGLVFLEGKLTYAKLDERSNQLANYLVEQGVETGMLVPLCMDRSLEVMIAILAILKAGAAYMPIDPGYPKERIRFMLSESSSPVVVTTSDYADLLETLGEGIEPLSLDKLAYQLHQKPVTPTGIVLSEQELAYVIYTSGSTGQPKGVKVTHGNVVSLVRGVNYVSFSTDDVLLSTGAPSFDATTFEYWGMLLNGGRLILCEEQTLLDPVLLKNEIVEQKVTQMWFTAGWFNQLVETAIDVFETLSVILVGGEKLSAKHVRKLLETYPAIEILNGYGPTENTTFSLTYPVKPGFAQNIPIGYPLSNRTVYVLNEQQQLLPIGVTGEIYLGGAGLSAGYLNRPVLTEEKFIPHPFAEKEGERLYRTGDLGKWLPDGSIAYEGRIDEQVKIRGFRIELGEIESVLQKCGAVSQAVVTVLTDEEGGKRLIGYVVPNGPYNQENIMEFLQQKLPDYMLPSLLVEMEYLPLTANGKVNKKELPAPEAGSLAEQAYVAPRNETEQTLAFIWQKILKIEQIGIHEDFFKLGGHSLLAIRLIGTIRDQMKLEVTVKAMFENTTIAALSQYLQLSGNKTLLPPITVLARPEFIPLSFSQERLWFIDQLEGSVHYYMPSVLKLKGKLNQDALAQALQSIVRRHEVLRSVIKSTDGIPYQEVIAADQWQLSTIEVKEELTAAINALILQPFELSADYMLRAGLIKLQEEEHLLVLTMHHIACDGWSINILVDELTANYQAALQNTKAQLPDLAIQYADYAIWQRTYLAGEVLKSQQDYWSAKLGDAALLELPLDFERPAIQSTRGALMSFHIDRSLTDQLNKFSQQQDVTLFITLLSSFYVLLSRYSRQDDITVGTPIAGRRQKESEALIGFFINTLALRCDLSASPTFLELVKQVKTTSLEGYDNQDIPFEKIVEAVVKDRDRSRTPLFQAMLVLQNTPEEPELILGDLTLSGEAVEHTSAKFDLNFMMEETAEGLDLTIVYCTGLFRETTIARMAKHYEQLLKAAVTLPSQNVKTMKLLSSQEENEIVHVFNETAAVHQYVQDKTIIDLFLEQVNTNPDAVAAIYEDQQLTYRELDQRTDELGRYLQKQGVKEDTLVAICINRSLEMVIAIIGILKAGGAYVPIDLAFPEERIRFILKDTGAAICITDGAVYPGEAVTYLNIKDDWSAIGSEIPQEAPLNASKPTNLVYVIYTSGSTGNPKGVMITHDNLVDYIYGLQQKCAVNACSSFALVPAIATDLGNTILFGALAAGGTLHIISGDLTTDALSLNNYFETHIIDCLKIVPSHWKALCIDGKLLLPAQLLIFGGEALQDDVVKQLRLSETSCEVFNHYGPTETTIGKCMYQLDLQQDYTGVPIGNAFSDTTLYILDAEGGIVPVGAGGELCIGGRGVARGYLNLPELTTEKFVRNPYSTAPDARIYKTGDLVCWLPDGNIRYMGRIDDQVKIRGYRVEPGEIERVLQGSGLVNHAVVLAKTDHAGNKYLAGYVVPKDEFNKEQLMEFLSGCLPAYMVPAIWVSLAEMPLTVNGKINRKVLPEPDTHKLTDTAYAGPRNIIERKLAGIWQELLGIETIGIDDNFFELGGHSLITVRLLAQIRKMGYAIQLNALMIHKTIETQAALLTGLLTQNETSLNEHLILLSKTEGDQNLFILPGGDGNPDWYDQLAVEIHQEGAVYGLKMIGLLEGEIPLDTVAEIAAQNIEWIKEVQPEGPYRLAGHSFGGYVLYEMIRQLENLDEQVEQAILLDIPVRANIYPIPVDSLVNDALIYLEENKFITQPYPAWIAEMKAAIEQLPVHERRAFMLNHVKVQCLGKGVLTDFLARTVYLMICNSTMEYYISGKVNAALTVVRALEQEWEKMGFDENLGWAPHADEIQPVGAPGNHVTMLKGENARTLAIRLNQYPIHTPITNQTEA